MAASGLRERRCRDSVWVNVLFCVGVEVENMEGSTSGELVDEAMVVVGSIGTTVVVEVGV